MVVSRRTILASAVAAAAVRPAAGVTVACRLEESRRGFGQLQTSASNLRGGLLLVESSAGFADENLAWLRDWGISVHEPREVRGPAWIQFRWPISVLIRDFGRACRVSGGSAIAWLGDMPVAVRQGPLVVLGSPLGPHLYAGDFDAHDLYAALLRYLVTETTSPVKA